MAAWVRQDAIPSYICVNPCYLWETLLYKKLLCVPCVLWEYSSPTDCTDQHRWLVALVRPRNPQNSQKFGCVSGCVGMAGCHTLLHLCKSVLSVGDHSLQEASVSSVGSVGIQFSHRLHRFSQMAGCVSGCVGTAGCHTLLQSFCAFRGFCGSTTACLVGAAETAAPPELASVGGYFMNVAAWVWQDAIPSYKASVRSVRSVGDYSMNVAAWVRQDAIPSYTMGSEMPCIF